MRFQLQKRSGQPLTVTPEIERLDADTIISSTSWLRPDGSRTERYQVLRLRDDKIVDIQGCASRREAERFARRAR